MDLKINSLKIENFKGIKFFEVKLDGGNAVIKAENGIGKTTIYDAFLYLLFSKDSTGRKDFDLRPLDENNQAIKGLVLVVEAEIELHENEDTETHIFRKENHENIIKNQLRGYNTLCTIDEVPKKVNEFQDYITEIIPEDTFKMLTNLRHFNEGIHWKERRSVLLDIAGEIGTPEGFDELLAALNGRTIDEYKKVLAERKKRFTDEREEINPRIDEISKGLTELSGKNVKQLEVRRTALGAEIKDLDNCRKDLFDKEKDRQQQLENVNALKGKLVQREAELKNDTSRIRKLLEEKSEIEQKLSMVKQAVQEAETNVSLKKSQITGKQAELNLKTSGLVGIQQRYKRASEAPADDNCYTCGQKWPADKISEIKLKRKNELLELTRQGNETMEIVEVIKKEIEQLQVDLANLNDKLTRAKAVVQEGETYKAERFAEIDKLVKANVPPSPKQDKTCQDLNIEIARAEKEVGEPVSQQLQKIDETKTAKQEELNEINNALAQADRAKKDKERIAELEQQEKDLAQKIADVEKELAAISDYTQVESRLIEDSVNKKFKHVNFKLFNFLLNKEIEPCCEAMLNGVPYGDMSYGQKIFVGIDIINVLSEHCGLSAPLFIDNAEGMTLPVEFNGQTIQLFAQKDISKLTVEKTSAVKPKSTKKSKELFNVNVQ